MKILLAIPKDTYMSNRESVIPLGIAYINGALRSKNFDVVSCNLNYAGNDVYEYLKELISSYEIDVLMCGGTSYHYHAIREIFKAAKRIKPSIITVGGGVGYTAQPMLFSKMTCPDYVILGEGEESACELMSALTDGKNVQDVSGIMYKTKDGSYVATPNRPLIKDVNGIAFPSYEGFCLDEYFKDLSDYSEAVHYDYDAKENSRVMPMLFGRSCPYDCKFCFHTIGRAYRSRSLDNFFQELNQLIMNYSITGITIMDEFFGVNKSVIYDFCERIKPYNLKWFAELRVDAVDRALLSKMKEAGCTNVLYGLESMNQELLDDMNKHITVEQIKEALEASYEVGINISGNFVVGTPKETLETFYETFDWWNRNRKYQIDFVYLQLYPGTEYYRQARERGLIPNEELFLDTRMPEINISKMNSFEFNKVQRIIRLTKLDNVMGGCFDLIQNKIRLVCNHCQEEEYIDYDKRIWEQMTHKCKSCGHKTTYGYNRRNNGAFNREIMQQYAMNSAFGYGMDNWLKARGYESVVLVGNGEPLLIMLEEMRHYGVKIKAITDFNFKWLKAYEGALFCESVIDIRELSDLKDVDAVILCSFGEYERELAQIRGLGYLGVVDTMANAILNHNYFIEENVMRLRK